MGEGGGGECNRMVSVLKLDDLYLGLLGILLEVKCILIHVVLMCMVC